MKIDKSIWQQLKGVTKKQVIKALQRDGCVQERLTFYHPQKKYRITIHYHAKKTFSPYLIKNYLLAETGWTIKDLKRLKLVK